MKRILGVLLVVAAVGAAAPLRPMLRIYPVGLSLGYLVGAQSHMSMDLRVLELAGGVRFTPHLGALAGVFVAHDVDAGLAMPEVAGYLVYDHFPQARWRRVTAFLSAGYALRAYDGDDWDPANRFVEFTAGLGSTFYAFSPRFQIQYIPKLKGVSASLGIDLGGTYVLGR